MKNKNYIIFLLLALVVGLFSCLPDEFEMNEFSDVFITWSPLTIKVNGDVSLGDGSRGETSRLWTFPGNGVCEIIGSNELTSTERIVHAIFFQPGTYDVRLQAEFNDPTVTLDSLITITVLDQ
ncbi:MAG: PKD domain-containing protein [Mariniphaga sp.]|nr:PKD domain-containing protein [Mariniphaga sp.]